MPTTPGPSSPARDNGGVRGYEQPLVVPQVEHT